MPRGVFSSFSPHEPRSCAVTQYVAAFGETIMLVVDIGNTHTRIALFAQKNVIARRLLRTASLTLESCGEALTDVLAENPKKIMWVASVKPAANALVAAAAEKISLRPRFIMAGKDAILPHRLETPQSTGVDRLLAALAAGELYFADAKKGYLVIQCGSAVTVDKVDGDGCFLGGHILPGPGFWLSGLAGAAQLPNLSCEDTNWQATGPGASTHDAILHGMAAGLPGAILASVHQVDARRPDDQAGSDTPEKAPPTVVTGGWGGVIAGRLDFSPIFDADLLLHGIRIWAEREEGGSA